MILESRTLLLTAFDAAMAPIGSLTSPLMVQYANRHGFDFHITRNIDPDSAPYWQKIWDIAHFLKTGLWDRILWLDADQMITNMEWEPPWQRGFHASMDWGTDATDPSHFSACGMLVCRDMLPMIQRVVLCYSQFEHSDFPEQTALRHVKKNSAEYLTDWIKTHPRRTFNAVPIELCPTAPEPWQPGDFSCHLTHVPVDQRVEMFHQIQSRLNAPQPTPDDPLTTAPISNDASAFLPGE
jgi:hypothetical protein